MLYCPRAGLCLDKLMYFNSSFSETMSNLHYNSQIQNTKSHFQRAQKQWHLKRLFSIIFLHSKLYSHEDFNSFLMPIPRTLQPKWVLVIKQMYTWLKIGRCHTNTINVKRCKNLGLTFWLSSSKYLPIAVLHAPKSESILLEVLWKALPF